MIDLEPIYQAMLKKAPAAFGAAWDKVKIFLPAELRKMAVQLAEIADNVSKFAQNSAEGYPPETGRVLLRMQRRALENVLIAVTALTLIAVEQSINGILDAAREVAGGVLDVVL
jgi:hypothetical protein